MAQDIAQQLFGRGGRGQAQGGQPQPQQQGQPQGQMPQPQGQAAPQAQAQGQDPILAQITQLAQEFDDPEQAFQIHVQQLGDSALPPEQFAQVFTQVKQQVGASPQGQEAIAQQLFGGGQ